MNGVDSELKKKAEVLLEEGYKIWESGKLPALPESEKNVALDVALSVCRCEKAVHFAAACQSFYLFRKLHAMVSEHPVWATLLGDYFFSLFSKNLIPIDSVRLTDEFAKFLSDDARIPVDKESYLSFVRGLPAVFEA